MEAVDLHSKLQLVLMDWVYQNEEVSRRVVDGHCHVQRSHSVLGITSRLDPPEIHKQFSRSPPCQ